MNANYADIIDRVVEAPIWFDEHAVPRYCPFKPNETASIYADEAVLFEIECQRCATPFLVCMTSDPMSRMAQASLRDGVFSLEKRIPDTLEYGDPPNIECCAAGPTMKSVPLRVVEFWRRVSRPPRWVRAPELEVALTCEWQDERDGGAST